MIPNSFNLEKNLVPPENSAEMVQEFIKNPKLASITKDLSALLLESIDRNYFSREIIESEKELLKIVVRNFIEKDPIYEIRSFKTVHYIYDILKTYEALGLISINKPLITEDQIKEKANKIWIDYKKKKNMV